MLLRPCSTVGYFYSLPVHLAIALSLATGTLGASDSSVTPCQVGRWGDLCKHACHCRNDSSCSSNGFCEGGCTDGWLAPVSEGPCVREEPVGTDPISDKDVLLSKSHVSYRHSRSTGSKRGVSWGAIEYKYDLDFKKSSTTQSYSNCSSYTLTGQFPVTLAVSSVNISFVSSSGIGHSPSVHIFHHKFPSYKNSGNISSESNDTFLQFIFEGNAPFGNSAELTMAEGGQCEVNTPEMFSVAGTPICPYDRWGRYCDNRCTCSCEGRKCLIFPPDCMFAVSICPQGSWGPNCARKCLKHKCGEDKPKCHIIHGSCSECPNMTGTKYDCAVDRDKQHNTYSNKILPLCWNNQAHSEDESKPRGIKIGSLRDSSKNEKGKELSRTAKAAIAGLIVVFAFILVVMALCMWYYCPWGGKKRRKAPSLNGSQLSLTGDSDGMQVGQNNDDWRKSENQPKGEGGNQDDTNIKKKRVSIAQR